jgi:hypothetical protein
MLNTTRLFILAAVVMIGGVVASSAQVAPQSHIKTNVPFSFVIDGKTYPAGTYTFGRLDTTGNGDSSQLIMRGTKGEFAILTTIPTISSVAAKDTQLVFDKVAGQYFLTRIFAKGDTEGSELISTAAQRTAIAATGKNSTGESSATSSDSN